MGDELELEGFRFFSGTGHLIDTGMRVARSNIAAVIYGKPNLVANPKTCLFTVGGTPKDIATIYSNAAGPMANGVETDYMLGWNSAYIKTHLDVIFKQWNVASASYVAIAFNLDDTVNASNTYYYDFGVENQSTTTPLQMVSEGDTTKLAWIQGDLFSDGTETEANLLRRKTVVFVCPVGGVNPPYISFSLAYLEVQKNDPSFVNPHIFDPKIKNDG